MTQTSTNLSQGSLVQSRIVGTSLRSYLDLESLDANNQTKHIIVFPNVEYTITFYDANYGAVRSITGLVTNLWDDQIKIKYKGSECDQIQCCTCTNTSCTNKQNSNNSSLVSTSKCVLNRLSTTNSNYEDLTVAFIPVSNIISVSCLSDGNGCQCSNTTTSSNNTNDQNTSESRLDGGHKVMLLGISANAVRALVIHLEFLDDSVDEAVKYVDLAVGNTYNVVYEVNKTHGCHDHQTIYEMTGKLVKIEEVQDMDDTQCSCQTGKGFVRQEVGLDDTVYTCVHTTKDNFMKAPPMKGIKLIFDTSINFYGKYESIMISQIRDCSLVDGSNTSDDLEPPRPPFCVNCGYKTEDCDPDNCPYCIPIQKPSCTCDCNNCDKEFHREYAYPEDLSKAVIDGDIVKIECKGITVEKPIEEIIKFYMGIE